MSPENTPAVSAEVAPYLNEIAARLWSGHAAVLVGSGFSKNARKTNPSAPDFPDWQDLGDSLYEKLHGQGPAGKTAHYLTPLRLADEVRATFGGVALDQLVRTAMPDREHEPAELHARLLELPWVDVFTTNYDTLLERATSMVTSRRFDVVVTKEDLVYSSRPRIVKLHGSLPSTRPFVVSEDDYRRYPQEFAPFVNSVQQALIENTLCLIGFSGDDPNFLRWIGWVRDNLGAHGSPRMYLIGLPSLTAAQVRLLEQRNIGVVDLAACPGVDGEHGKAFSVFFGYLLAQRPTPLDWPGGRAVAEGSGHPTEERARAWKRQRESYPNWVVAPKAARERVSLSLRGEDVRRILKATATEPAVEVSLLYELNWRFERVLWPLPNDLVPHYERLLDSSEPFARPDQRVDGDTGPAREPRPNGDKSALPAQCIDLSLSLLRFYREEGMGTRWSEWNDRVGSAWNRLSPEQVARLSYERCLNAVFALDPDRTRQEIRLWPVNEALPFWEAKRAGLMAELGDLGEAREVLENALTRIRGNQQLAPVTNDFTWVAQESHVMHLLHVVDTAMQLTDRQRSPGDTSRRQFHLRWNELKQYKCDPWGDMELFEAHLSAPWTRMDATTRASDFDIGKQTVTHHIGPQEHGPLLGYTFLRYCEEVGLPLALPAVSIGKSQVEHAAERIAEWNSAWAVATIVRAGDRKLADVVFGRDAVARMNVGRVDEQVGLLITTLRAVQPLIAPGDRLDGRGLAARIGHVIPEVLSRLCTKCSAVRLGDVLTLLRELYDHPRPSDYSSVANLTKRLLSAMPVRQQYESVPNLLGFPLLGQGQAGLLESFPEPSAWLRKSSEVSGPRVCVDVTVMSDLLAKVASSDSEERSRACLRARALHRLGFLNEAQTAGFADALWRDLAPDGFPAQTPFQKWVFLELPSPAGLDPIGLFRAYFSGFSFGSIDAGSGVRAVAAGKAPLTMTRGRIPFCSDVLQATKRRDGGFVEWSLEEASALLAKLADWWDAGKHRLRETGPTFLFGDVAGEFRARYRSLVRLLAEVVAPRLTAETDSLVRERLQVLLKELDAYGQPALWAHAASIAALPDTGDSVLARIDDALAARDQERVVDALEAVRHLALTPAVGTGPGVQSLVEAVAQQIKWRRDGALNSCLLVMRDIVEGSANRVTPEVRQDVLAGLAQLRQESDPRAVGADWSVDDRLNHRVVAATLARSLHDAHLEARLSPPEVLLEWERVCADAEEFAEVRNAWER